MSKTPKKTEQDENTWPKTITEKGVTVYIYFTPTKKGGKEYPGHTLVYTAAGKRKRQGVADYDTACETAKKIARQLSEGTGHAHTLTPSMVADYIAADRAARELGRPAALAEIVGDYVAAAKHLPAGSSLRDAVTDFARRHSKKTQRMTTKVSEVVKAFCEDKAKEEVSDYYLKPLRRIYEKFASDFRCAMSSIEGDEIKAWIEAKYASRNTRIHRRDDLATLFRWARDKGYLPEEERTVAQRISFGRPTTRTIGTYTPEELAKILSSAPPRLVPVIAISAFAGVRSKEVFELDWSAVRLVGGEDDRTINLTPETAKTKVGRAAPVPPALVAWLKPYAKKSGRVSPPFQNLDNMTRLITKTVQAAGVKPQKNGFRHSFGTYRLAVTKNAPQTSLEMGNSVRKLLERYNKVATKAQGDKWFAVTPPKNRKIIDYPAAAA
jgi:hypothetical protein